MKMFFALNFVVVGYSLWVVWLSNCEWNQLDGREAGLDLIIGDFGEM